jgi:hypothetical protein
MSTAVLPDRLRWRHRCKARNRDGQRCGRWAAPWQMVCKNHGAASPQALAAAQERQGLALLRLWGINEAVFDFMQRIIADPDAKNRDKIAVAKLVFDLLLPVGYEPRSRYAFTEDEITEVDEIEIEDLPEIEDLHDDVMQHIPDVVA